MLMCLLVGSAMCLRVAQEGDRRRALLGRRLEIWSKQKNVWMSWSSRAPGSSNNWRNTETIRDILYTQRCLDGPLALFLGRVCVKDPNLRCCSDPWPQSPRWAMSPITTSAPSAVSRTKQSLLSRLQPTPNWKFQTQKGWDGTSGPLHACLQHLKVVTNSGVLILLPQESLQIYLKSKNGPIEVYLCPEDGLEDASPVKSVSTPKKEFPPAVCTPHTTSIAPPSCSIKEEPVECKLSSL